LEDFYEAMGATEIVRGDHDHVNGHTVIDSIQAITRLSSEEFYRLYGQSTNRALVFTRVTRGESPLVALRVVSPTPNAVVLHGIEDGDLWDHAADLARVDGVSLATSNRDLDDCLADLQAL
jgi:putative transcriptional regulator